MALWSLTPLQPEDPSWEASSYRGVVIVRAPNEARAREAAAKAFDVKTRFEPGAGVHFPPWTRPALVKAERIRDPRFAAEGPTEVLEPRL
ncbi:MAG: hypothetical protein K6U10_14405 [Acidobacteriia bacterium]|nr:hypothetical protein [Methyloceanibacter sp.]MCL6492994.1 hypothetical protein [Terriglobia bacterium]